MSDAQPVRGTGERHSGIRSAPTLETERLILRPFERADFEPYHAILAKPEVHRHLGPPLGREDLWRRAVGSVGMWAVLGFGGWMVIRKADIRLVGSTGFFDGKRDLEPDFGGLPEMGWIFDPQVHGQGIAGEACTAALDWLDDHLQPTPVWAIIDPDNAPSIRLGHRLGFELVTEAVYHGDPTLVVRRPVRT